MLGDVTSKQSLEIRESSGLDCKEILPCARGCRIFSRGYSKSCKLFRRV